MGREVDPFYANQLSQNLYLRKILGSGKSFNGLVGLSSISLSLEEDFERNCRNEYSIQKNSYGLL